MAKEKFERTKPHVNVGVMGGCAVLLLAGVGAAAAGTGMLGWATFPNWPAAATVDVYLALTQTESAIQSQTPTATQVIDPAVIEGQWTVYEDQCGFMTYGLQVHGRVPKPSAEAGWVVLVLGPPNGEGVPQSLDLLIYPGGGSSAAAATATNATVVNTEMVALELKGMWSEHPDFLWWPTGAGGGAPDGSSNGGYLIETLEPAGSLGGSGDTLIERWQSSGIGHSLPEPSVDDLSQARVLVLAYPDVAGLFKDTAEGETGGPYLLSFLNAGPADASGEIYDYPGLYWVGDDGVTPGQDGYFWSVDGAAVDTQDGEDHQGQYFFVLGLSGGPVVIGGLWSGADELPAEGGGYNVELVSGQLPPSSADDAAAWNEFLSQMQWSDLVGWATASGLKASVEAVEWQEGGPCPTVAVGLTQPLILATATATAEGSPTDTPGPTPQPSRTPEPTREPPKPTATKRP